MTVKNTYEAFVREIYPMHYQKLRQAQSQLTLPILRGVLSTCSFFGLPLSAFFWGVGLFFEAQAHQLQEGQKPLPLIQYVEPATVVAICLTLIVTVCWGALQGWQKEKKFRLQMEEDELKLRTDFLLRELVDREFRRLSEDDEKIVVKSHKDTAENRMPVEEAECQDMTSVNLRNGSDEPEVNGPMQMMPKYPTGNDRQNASA